MTFPDNFIIGIAVGMGIVSWRRCGSLRKEIKELQVYRDWHGKRIDEIDDRIHRMNR